MKKLSLRFAAALIGFALGLSATWVWSSWGGSQTLPYCEVARNGEHYHNQIVRVRTTLIMGSDAMYIFEDCDPVEALMARVEMNGGAAVTDKGHYLDRLSENSPDSPPERFDAIVEGRFDAQFSMGCWVPKYHIAATKVEILTPATNEIPRMFDEEGRRVKH